MKIPEDQWQVPWSPGMAQRIESLAGQYRREGAPSDLSAWRAAEMFYIDQRNPEYRRAMRNAKKGS